jgi:hypothetical protein
MYGVKGHKHIRAGIPVGNREDVHAVDFFFSVLESGHSPAKHFVIELSVYFRDCQCSYLNLLPRQHWREN